jgi:hypothetical protein
LDREKMIQEGAMMRQKLQIEREAARAKQLNGAPK